MVANTESDGNLKTEGVHMEERSSERGLWELATSRKLQPSVLSPKELISVTAKCGLVQSF